MHIAVDADDVLVSFWPRVLRCFNKEWGEDIGMDAQNDWGDNPLKRSDHFGEGRKYETWWDWWKDRQWLWSGCDAIDGAIGGLARLGERHYIELVTHKPDWARREMTQWLAEWHPHFDQLTLVHLDESKAEASDADLLIDDKPKNVYQWRQSGRPALLFTQPWNTYLDQGVCPRIHQEPPSQETLERPSLPCVVRADDWSDVLDLIAELDGPVYNMEGTIR